jgi:hypothetical protein
LFISEDYVFSPQGGNGQICFKASTIWSAWIGFWSYGRG